MDKYGELHFNIRALNLAGFTIQVEKENKYLMMFWHLVTIVPFTSIHILVVTKFFLEPYSILRTIFTVYMTNNGLQIMFKHTYLKYQASKISPLLQFLKRFIVEVRKRTKNLMIFWYCFTMIPYILIHVLAVVKFIVAPYSLFRTIVTAYLMNNGTQTMFKHAYLWYQGSKISQLLKFLKQCPTNDCDEIKILDLGMRLQSAKHTKRFSAVIFLYNLATCLFVVCMPLIIRVAQVAYCSYVDVNIHPQCKGIKALYVYEFWWPSDIYATPTCYYLVAWEVVMILVFFATSCTSDAFVCTLMLAAAERSSMLSRAASQALRSGGPDGALAPTARAWIIYHQHYLRLVEKTSEVVAPLLFVTLSFAALNIICYLYVIIKFDDETISNMALSVMAGFLVQIFVYTFAGQKLRTKSGELSRSVLKASMTSRSDMCGPSRSALQILSARCSGNLPECFTGLGFFTVSMDFFAKVVSASVSYLLVILQLCNCKGLSENYHSFVESHANAAH